MHYDRCVHLAPNHPDVDRGGGAVYSRFIRRILEPVIGRAAYKFVANARIDRGWIRRFRAVRAVLLAWPMLLPARVIYLAAPQNRAVRKALRGFSGCVVYDHSEAYYWSRFSGQEDEVRSLLILHNLEWRVLNGRRRGSRNVFSKIFYWAESHLMYDFERRAITRADVVVCISKVEERFVRRIRHGRAGVVHVPPGLSPMPEGAGGGPGVGLKMPTALEGVFIGNLDWPPNAAGLRFGERIAASVPGLRIKVLGGGAFPADVSVERIRSLGFVPDLHAELASADVLLGLSRGGAGLNVKIVDGIYARLPIATFRLASLAFPSHVRSHFHIASTVDEWCEMLDGQKFPRDDGLYRDYINYLDSHCAVLCDLATGA